MISSSALLPLLLLLLVTALHWSHHNFRVLASIQAMCDGADVDTVKLHFLKSEKQPTPINEGHTLFSVSWVSQMLYSVPHTAFDEKLCED